MKILLLLLVAVLLLSCEKEEPLSKFKEEWKVESKSDVRVYYILNHDGSDKVTYDRLRSGESKSFKIEGAISQEYFGIEVECQSAGCSYMVDKIHYTETKIFRK